MLMIVSLGDPCIRLVVQVNIQACSGDGWGGQRKKKRQEERRSGKSGRLSGDHVPSFTGHIPLSRLAVKRLSHCNHTFAVRAAPEHCFGATESEAGYV